MESYCDDLNVITDEDQDILKLSNIVNDFELISGSILSRDKKCTVLGLGKWVDRDQWPLTWLRTVKSVKVFGIHVSDSYKQMVSENWNFRLQKFNQTLYSWSSRTLDTLQQRVEVLRLFALSRVYYVGSILPMRVSHVKKFEAAMGKFIWKGRILKVALGELKNDHMSGGLNLPCVKTMNDSLLSSQCLRLLRSGDRKSIDHIDLWMGSLLEIIIPGMGNGAWVERTPEYFTILADNLAKIMTSELLTDKTLKSVTNRKIYKDIANFPLPRIVMDAVVDTVTWKRLHNHSSSGCVIDCMFLLIHNKLPVPERLHRIGVHNNPNCQFCPGQERANILHYFALCIRTKSLWEFLKAKIERICGVRQISDSELLNLTFPRTGHDRIITWIIGLYVNYIWRSDAEKFSIEKFFGYLTFKYKEQKEFLGQVVGLE